MAKDGRHSIRLDEIKPYLERLAKTRRRSVSQLVYLELERLVKKNFPDFKPRDQRGD